MMECLDGRMQIERSNPPSAMHVDHALAYTMLNLVGVVGRVGLVCVESL